jgi:hypothetical protein
MIIGGQGIGERGVRGTGRKQDFCEAWKRPENKTVSRY